MKLRIKGPSLRLRLTQGEIRTLAERGSVEERVPFGADVALVYRLRKDAAAREISASYAANVLEIRVPERLASHWCASQEVTLAQAQAVPEGSLQITLEKDFACLVPREGEDEADNFPHPLEGSGKSC